MIQTEPTTRSEIFAAYAILNNLKEPCERCRLCNQLISIEDEKLPLEEGACYFCKFGPTGDPEETEER
tara:strand:- start:175 stop:378 length:204 start_codon:yes stop_codon:yes gene_type:complete